MTRTNEKDNIDNYVVHKPEQVKTIPPHKEYQKEELDIEKFAAKYPWWEPLLGVLLSSSSCIFPYDSSSEEIVPKESHYSENIGKEIPTYQKFCKNFGEEQIRRVLERKKQNTKKIDSHRPIELEKDFVVTYKAKKKGILLQELTKRPENQYYGLAIAHYSEKILNDLKEVFEKGLGIQFEINLRRLNILPSPMDNVLPTPKRIIYVLKTKTKKSESKNYQLFQEVLHWCHLEEENTLDAIITCLSDEETPEEDITHLPQVSHKQFIMDIEFENGKQPVNNNEIREFVRERLNELEKATESLFPFQMTKKVITWWLILSGMTYKSPYIDGETEKKETIVEILTDIPYDIGRALQVHWNSYIIKKVPQLGQKEGIQATGHFLRYPYMFNIQKELINQVYQGRGHYLPQHGLQQRLGKLKGYLNPYLRNWMFYADEIRLFVQTLDHALLKQYETILQFDALIGPIERIKDKKDAFKYIRPQKTSKIIKNRRVKDANTVVYNFRAQPRENRENAIQPIAIKIKNNTIEIKEEKQTLERNKENKTKERVNKKKLGNNSEDMDNADNSNEIEDQNNNFSLLENNNKPWTKIEENYLIKNSEKPLKEVARHLRRGIGSIKWKRQELGLKRKKIKNLVGKRFGRLVVIRAVGRIGRRVAWLCKCDCGNETVVSSTHLIQGDTNSCGCLNRELSSERVKKDLTGKKIGDLRVIREKGRTEDLQVLWECECDCGNMTEVITRKLLNGNTESCGCRRGINQREGKKWERLVNEFLKFKFKSFHSQYHLPNNKFPDFYVPKLKIILDTKRHDYLMIEECIEKYSQFCNKLVFICMIKRRENWRNDFKNNPMVEFWYPEDMMKWIPIERQKEFQIRIKNIKELWKKPLRQKKKSTFDRAIDRVESKGFSVNQTNVAREMGSGKNLFREKPELAKLLRNYIKDKDTEVENKLLALIKGNAIAQINEEKKVTSQGVAKRVYENYFLEIVEIFYRPGEYPPPRRKFINKIRKRINTSEICVNEINRQNETFNKEKKEKLLELMKEMTRQEGKANKNKIWNENKDIFYKSDVYDPEYDSLLEESVGISLEEISTINYKTDLSSRFRLANYFQKQKEYAIKKAIIKEAIHRLKKRRERISQETVGQEIGFSKELFRKNRDLAKILHNLIKKRN